jgi:NAD(P)-dependent dehydrogenase (short-subunit alcohol dehydrogenase family)
MPSFRAESPFLEGSFEEWTRNIEVNLTGPYNICRNVLPLMKKKRWGRIIFFSGIAPYLGVSAAKATVKLGIVGFTRGIAREFGDHGITANCVGPGSIHRGERAEGESVKELLPGQPIRRKGRAEEVTSLVVYLCSENAGFTTGQCYLANGGAYFQ